VDHFNRALLGYSCRAPKDEQGLSWRTTIRLRETAGVAATITGLRIDGEPQRLADYFPSPDIDANGSLTANFLFRNMATPLRRSFELPGTDANGNR
jgi:hypothetical protein